MTAFGYPPTHSRRSAFTLLEVLLVLSLLLILASFTWPALERPLASQRLYKSADKVRVEWTRARVHAMSSGRTYVFRFAIGEDRYAIEAQSGPEFVSETASVDEFGRFVETTDTTAVLQCTEHSLPEGITFAGGETTFDSRAASFGSDSEQLSAAEQGWSDPVLFYPDGTTSTTRLQLKNEYDHHVELALRGLTGTVTVGDSYFSEE